MQVTSKNEEALQAPDRASDVLVIGELAVLIGRRWKLVLVWVLIGLACSLGVWSLMPEKWQGDMVVQIGKLPERESRLIESPDQLAARVTARTFLDKVCVAAGYSQADMKKSDVDLFAHSLKANPVRSTDLVQISFLAYSKDELEKFAGALRQEILAAHAETFSAVKGRLDSQLQDINTKIAAAEQSSQRIQAELKGGKGGAEPGNVVAIGVLQANVMLIDSLGRTKSDVERLLSPAVLYPTSVTAVVVGDTPASPKLGICMALGILAGLVIGVIAALVSRFR